MTPGIAKYPGKLPPPMPLVSPRWLVTSFAIFASPLFNESKPPTRSRANRPSNIIPRTNKTNCTTAIFKIACMPPIIEYKSTKPDRVHIAKFRDIIPSVNSLIRYPEAPYSIATKGIPNRSAIPTEIIRKPSPL